MAALRSGAASPRLQVEEEVAALSSLDGAALRQRCTELMDQPAPSVSPKLLRLAIAWQIQANAFGGLSPAVRRQLQQAHSAKSKTQLAGAGTRLVREWQGIAHVVTIDEKGTICWDGRTWRSLSAVARAITGGHWSGPAFFGLRKTLPTRKPTQGTTLVGAHSGGGRETNSESIGTGR